MKKNNIFSHIKKTFMELIYQFIWIVPFLPFLASILIGLGLLFFPKSTKSLRRVWAIASISLLNIAMSISFDIFGNKLQVIPFIDTYGPGSLTNILFLK
jgi:predicted membrane protein